jgi:hypothetical protein
MVEGARAQTDEDLSGACLGVGASSAAARAIGASSSWLYGFQGTMSSMTGAELNRLAEKLGLDASRAGPGRRIHRTERHIRDRRDRGLFADMKFTMAKRDLVSSGRCSPARGRCLRGARYYAPAPEQLTTDQAACLATRGITPTPTSARSSMHWA